MNIIEVKPTNWFWAMSNCLSPSRINSKWFLKVLMCSKIKRKKIKQNIKFIKLSNGKKKFIWKMHVMKKTFKCHILKLPRITKILFYYFKIGVINQHFMLNGNISKILQFCRPFVNQVNTIGKEWIYV